MESAKCRYLALQGLRVKPASFIQIACCFGSIRQECEVHRPIVSCTGLIHGVATVAVGRPNSTTIA